MHACVKSCALKSLMKSILEIDFIMIEVERNFPCRRLQFLLLKKFGVNITLELDIY